MSSIADIKTRKTWVRPFNYTDEELASKCPTEARQSLTSHLRELGGEDTNILLPRRIFNWLFDGTAIKTAEDAERFLKFPVVITEK